MPLQFFKSTDANAPTLTGQAGSLTTLLDACLVDGYTTASVSGITRSGSTATATLAVANTTLRTGDYVKFAGADQADYNVVAQVTVVNSTTLTYAVSNSPATPATGTITYRKAAAGWDTAFTGTNKRAYRSPNSASNRFYLRVDDSTTVGNVREAYARGYETMSDVDTGTGPFPTVAQLANGVSWNKSTTADSTARPWTLIADDKTMYLIAVLNGNTAQLASLYGFGHFVSYKPSDGYNTFVAGSSQTNYTAGITAVNQAPGLHYSAAIGATSSTANVFVARSYSQTGGSIQASVFDGRTYGNTQSTTSTMGCAAAGVQYPNAPDAGLWVLPVFMMDFTGSNNNVRGRMPGIYSHFHNSLPQSNYERVSGVVGLSGITLDACSVSNGYVAAGYVSAILYFDTTGPW